MVTVQVPQERDARPGDGPPETAPNCEALTPKAKATAGEPIRTPVYVWRRISVYLPQPCYNAEQNFHFPRFGEE